MKTLREARREAGLTQTQAAIICGVSLRTYQNWEHDIHKMSSSAKTVFKQKIEEMKMNITIIKEGHNYKIVGRNGRICVGYDADKENPNYTLFGENPNETEFRNVREAEEWAEEYYNNP